MMNEYVMLNNKREQIESGDFLNFNDAIRQFEYLIQDDKKAGNNLIKTGFYICQETKTKKEKLLYVKNNKGIIELGNIFTEKQRTQAVHELEFLRIEIKELYFRKMRDFSHENCESGDKSFQDFIYSITDNDICISYDLLCNGMDMYGSQAIKKQAELYLYEWKRIYQYIIKTPLLLQDEKMYQKHMTQYFKMFDDVKSLPFLRVIHCSGYNVGKLKKYMDIILLLDNACIERNSIYSIEEFDTTFQPETNQMKFVIQAKHYI